MSGGGRQNWNAFQEIAPRELLPASRQETDNRWSSGELEAFLTDVLKRINDHDFDAIDRHRASIRAALEKDFELDELNFGGSHSRHTDIAGLSDIDILAVAANERDLPSSSSAAVALLGRRLKERFPNTVIDVGDRAVSVRFSDGIEVQVLPALRRGDTYKIPDTNSADWISSNPSTFARRLTVANQRSNGEVVPTVKLVKHLIAKEGIGLKSYHIENLALRAFERFHGPYRKHTMVLHFLMCAKTYVHKNVTDLSGQSRDISDYMTDFDRRQASRKLEALERKLYNDSSNAWREAFGK